MTVNVRKYLSENGVTLSKGIVATVENDRPETIIIHIRGTIGLCRYDIKYNSSGNTLNASKSYKFK